MRALHACHLLLCFFALLLCACTGNLKNKGDKSKSNESVKPIALYLFNEGQGNAIHDVSREKPVLPLKIFDNGKNEITWNKKRGLHTRPSRYRVEKSSMIAKLKSEKPAAKIINKIKQSQEFSVELWFRPDNVEQTGPVRIISISKSNGRRNVTIGHSASAYDFRIRTSDVNLNGLPSLRTASSYQAKAELTHVVLTYDTNAAQIYINGESIPWFFYEGEPPGEQLSGNLTNWDDSFKLIIGDEFTGDRAWKGHIYYLAFYDRSLDQKQVLSKLSNGI